MGRGRQIAWIAAYALLLLLALRFCARTYPGWYFPDSRFLNWLLNGSRISTDFGYNLVLIAAAAGLACAFLPSDKPRDARRRRYLRLAERAALGLAVAILLYGLWFAAMIGRLPWQPGEH